MKQINAAVEIDRPSIVLEKGVREQRLDGLHCLPWWTSLPFDFSSRHLVARNGRM